MEKKYAIEADDELRIVEDRLSGYRAFGLKTSRKMPSETLKLHAEAVKEFEEDVSGLLTEFDDELNRQEEEIDKLKSYSKFFLKETKKIQWDEKPMLDRLRLSHIDNINALYKEKRSLRKDRIIKKLAFSKELADTRKEMSPFRHMFSWDDDI